LLFSNCDGAEMTTEPARPRAFVAYFRVSTDKQGKTGFGLEAQQQDVTQAIATRGGGGRLVAAFTEIESGKKRDRPELHKALAMCRAHRAVLIVAKLDRLARNASFLLTLHEGTGDDGVLFCDLPVIPPGPAGKFLITVLAAVAELEAGLISQRTKAALAIVKASGRKLGPPVPPGRTPGMEKLAAAARIAKARNRAIDLMPVIEQLRSAGAATFTAMASQLDDLGVPTPSGRGRWHAVTVSRLIAYAG
jgi:DNA invertase Pin-like site-specific DNA recombinase